MFILFSVGVLTTDFSKFNQKGKNVCMKNRIS